MPSYKMIVAMVLAASVLTGVSNAEQAPNTNPTAGSAGQKTGYVSGV